MHFQKENCKRKFLIVAGLFDYKNVVKMQFKNAKEAAQQKETLFFFQLLFTKVKQTSCFDVTVHLRYDVTGQELTDRHETLSRLAVTNTGYNHWRIFTRVI